MNIRHLLSLWFYLCFIQNLTTLNLSSNEISHDGAEYLANAIKNNTVNFVFSSSYLYTSLYFLQTITALDIGSNGIGDKGIQYVRKAYFFKKKYFLKNYNPLRNNNHVVKMHYNKDTEFLKTSSDSKTTYFWKQQFWKYFKYIYKVSIYPESIKKKTFRINFCLF